MSRKSSLWIIVILLLAAFFRLYDLKNVPPGLWADEAVNGVNTLQALSNGWKVFYPENFGREGLFINIQSLFVWALGTEPWVLRLPSAIIGILTVLGLYLMTKELYGRRVALFSAFFLATSFWHINFSRIGFRAIMAPFFLVWGFYLLFLGIRKSSEPRAQVLQDLAQRDGASRAIRQQANMRVFAKLRAKALSTEIIFAFAGLLFGAGFHTYLAYRIAPIIAIYPLWIFFKNYRAGKLRDDACAPCLIALFIIMAIVAASPLLIYYVQNPADFFGRTSGISVFQSENPLAQFSENFVKTFQMFFLFGDFNWRHNFAGASQLWWPVSLLFLLGLAASIVKTARNLKSEARNPKQFSNQGFAYKFTLIWFIIMLLPVVISNEGLPHALRAIVLIPPAMIFAALGLEFIIKKMTKRLNLAGGSHPPSDRFKLKLTILLFVFFLAAIAHSYNTYFNRWAPNLKVYESFQADLTEKAHWLKNAPNDIKKYVVTGEVERVDLTGSPMSLQPIIFITDTFFASKQKEKNVYYVALKDLENILCESDCVVLPVEQNTTLFRSIKQKIPSLHLDVSPGFVTFRK